MKAQLPGVILMELRRERVCKQFFCLGIIITVLSSIFLSSYLAATRLYKKTDGVCAEVQRDSRDNYNVYEFTVNGVTYTYKDYCTHGNKTQKGDIFPVRYDPNDPNKTFDADAVWIAAIALGMGILFTASGLKKRDSDNMPPIWADDDPANKYYEKRNKNAYQ